MRRFPLLLVAVCCALLLLAAVTVYAYQCNFYSDAKVIWVAGYGETCGSFGSGCTECWDTQSAEHCVEAGFSNCFQEENQLPP